MAPKYWKYWMISDRTIDKKKLGRDKDDLRYWVGKKTMEDALGDLGSWLEVSADRFKALLLGAIDQFPVIMDQARHEDQKHLTVFLHGYNTDWKDSVARYKRLTDRLFAGEGNLGICVLFNPKKGCYVKPRTLALIREVLRGVDRGVLVSRGLAPREPILAAMTLPSVAPEIAPVPA